MKRSFVVIALFILLVLIMGCNGATATPPSATRPPLETAEIEEQVQLPTVTPRASSMPTPSQTPNLTETTEYQVYASTQTAYQTLIAQFPRVCDSSYGGYPSISPNGEWLADTCYSDTEKDLILAVSQRNSDLVWKLQRNSYIGNGDKWPDGGITPTLWTTDGKYLFFYTYYATSGGECYIGSTPSAAGLFRIDLSNGTVTPVLQPQVQYLTYGFALSPTQRRLAYISRAGGMNILDLQNGKSISLDLPPQTEAGGFLWSSDGLSLAYSTATQLDTGTKYSIWFADSKNGQSALIFESKEICFVATSWSDDNIVIIENFNFPTQNTFSYFDVNKFALVSPTSAP